MLAEPYVRERIEQSFNQVRQEAAAKAEQTSRLAEAMQAHYQQATNNLTAEANALLLAQFPELASRNADELRGKLEMLQQSEPAACSSLRRSWQPGHNRSPKPNSGRWTNIAWALR